MLGMALLVLSAGTALAQTGTISGRVTEAETGNPLPGATVQIQEIGVGTATDPDGTYELSDVPVGTYEMSVSFVGYATIKREVRVQENRTNRQNFTLRPDAGQLEEVVVTGYAAAQKRVETGSSARVGTDQLEGQTVRSADQAVQGRAAGVRVTSASGQPGAAAQFRVRGSGSINGSDDPLYIVDGIQLNNSSNADLASTNPLSSIAPSDIESIEVLKDGAAASIYGAQAANGVVIITTKSGSSGRTEVDFSAQLGTVDRITTFDVMNTDQYFQYRAQAFANTYAFLPTFEEAREFAIGFLAPPDLANLNLGDLDGDGTPNTALDAAEINTNWQDEVFQTGLTQTYNLSVRGGNDETRFYVSGRYQDDEGQVIQSLFRQGGLQANVEHDVNDWLTISSRSNLATTFYSGTTSGGASVGSPFWAAQFVPPNSPVYLQPGNPDSGYNLNPNSTFNTNVVAQEDFNTRETYLTTINTSFALDLSLADNLAARTFAGINHEDTQEEIVADSRLPANAANGGSIAVDADRETNYNISQTLSFSDVFADVHAVNGLLGAEIRQEDVSRIAANGEQLPLFLFRTLASAAEPLSAFSAKTGFRQNSVFGSGDYTFDDTYRFAGTFRYDGSSRFGQDNRYGLFGTVSGLWRISNESFFDYDRLNNLALRASYGVTGSNSVGNFSALQLFGSSGAYNAAPTLAPSGLGNQSLTWEESWETNIGVDYEVFNGRLSGSVDVYRRDRERQLLGRDLPVDSGFGSFTDNVGAVRNEGLEFAISTINVDAGGFRWDTDFNISFQRSEVLELLPDDDELRLGALTYREGEQFGELTYVEYAGVNPANGRPMYLDADGELTYRPTADDEQLVGNLEPDFFGGIGNTFAYKGLSLDVFWQFDYGRTTLNNNAFFSDVGFFRFNKDDDMLNYWREPGDVAPEPLPWDQTAWPDGTSLSQFSTRFVEDASYIRLKQVKLTYRLPQSVLSRVGLRASSFFVQGENLLTFTEFTGPDPEIVGFGLADFPQARRLTTGVRVGI